MIEILCVIFIVAALALVVTPSLLDFRREARIAIAKSFIDNLNRGIENQKFAKKIKCNSDQVPSLAAVLMNDVTANESEDEGCAPEDLPDPQTRKFIDGDFKIPIHPVTGRNSIGLCQCSDPCDPDCFDSNDYCYDEDYGKVIGKGLGASCEGYLAESGIDSGSDSTGGETEGASGGADGDSGSDDGGPCVPDYQLNGFNLCEEINCGGGLVQQELCDNGPNQEEDFCVAEGGTWNGATCACPTLAEQTFWTGIQCVGCYSYQTFDGFACVDPPGCIESGGSLLLGYSSCVIT